MESKNLPIEKSIEDKIKVIIANNFQVEEKKITYRANFMDDLDADSLDVVELIMEFESQFNVSIPDADLQKINTVGEAIKYISKKIGTDSKSIENK